MKPGDLLYCRIDEDSYPLIANRIYQISKIGDRIELDLNPNLSLLKSEISEFFKSANAVLNDLKLKLKNKSVKDKIRALIAYIYFDHEVQKFLISKEFVDIFENTEYHHFIIRIIYIVLELLNKMTFEEVEAFYELEWEDVWNKIIGLMKENSNE